MLNMSCEQRIIPLLQRKINTDQDKKEITAGEYLIFRSEL